MGKRGKNQQKGPRVSKKIKLRGEEDVDVNNMDDEIDAFHKKRDMIPLDVNADVESDEDDGEQPVFDYEGIDDDEDDEEEEEDEEDEDDDINRTDLVAKMLRTQKYLKDKHGDVENVSEDDAEEENKGTIWAKGVGRQSYYNTDNKDYELLSSDEDGPAEEEEEVIKMLKERAELLSEEDFGLHTDEEADSDEEPTLGEMMVKDKTASKSSGDKEAEDGWASVYEVKKDLNSLSRDEQMDVVQSSAPELVGLLDELNDAINQLETQVNPLMCKVKKGDNDKKEGMHYLEVKQLLLLAYCQAITFYLLLKSEGKPVRDHPVIARLVEIKSMLDKIKELDGHLPNELEDILHEKEAVEPSKKSVVDKPALTFDLHTELNDLAGFPSEKQVSKLAGTVESIKKLSKKVEKKRPPKEDSVSLESAKMLQYRAALVEKLKLKAFSGSGEPKTEKSKKQKSKELNGKLETTDDFDDDAMDLDGKACNGVRSSTLSSKVSKFITPQNKTRKGVSGDDDLPERDDLGVKRLKHELRVMAGAGIKSGDDDNEQPENKSNSDEGEVEGNGETDESEDDYYNQVKQNRKAKLVMKAGKYSRTEEVYEPETSTDGKRHITTQMEKNKGLHRRRKKEYKNPRVKNKLRHASAVNRRKGQVQEIKKQKGSYGGQETGINPRVSRSIKIK